MSMRRAMAAAFTVLALLLPGGLPARADVLLTPFAGVSFGGDTERSRGTYGGALGFLGEGVTGFEIDFAFCPDFFGGPDVVDVFTHNNVDTLTGNLLVASPGNVRLYGTVGVGLIKSRLQDPSHAFDVDSSDFGFDAGGGLMLFVSAHIGLRGDLRYFRSFSERTSGGLLGHLDYWRGTGGITFRF
jgi:hypothetical protein